MKHPAHSKKVLITGIDGFTGIHLERYLEEAGFEVFGTVLEARQNNKHYICDLCDYNAINKVVSNVSPDYIIHLAAISFVGETDRSLIYNVNVLGTQNLLDALVANNIHPEKTIIASSATIYGQQESTVLDESMCPKPVNHYGISKLAMEQIVQTYFDKLDIIITRPFNYTGPGQAEHFLIPKIVKHFNDRKMVIELGNIDVAREFNDIRFVTDTYHKLMLSNTASEIINICSGNDIALSAIIATMEKIAGSTITISVNQKLVRENEIKSLAGSPDKLFSIIGTSSSMGYTIEDTLQSIYMFNENIKKSEHNA